MIRAHENPVAWRSGILSVLVHVVLVIILLVSFNWHSAKPLSVAQVELWDSLPQVQPQIEPVPMEKPIPEPPKPPPVIEKPVEKPVPPPETKADIVIKKKPVEVKPKEEKPKPDLAKLAREEELKRQKELEQKQLEKKQLEKERQEKLKQQEELRKIQQLALEDYTKNTQHEQQSKDTKAAQAQSVAALAGEVDKYKSSVISKIKPFVNKQLCGSGNPVLIYEIILLPTGEISGSPKLTTSSGVPACDEAVERAIRLAAPLPKPSADIFSQVRELSLKFRPNDAS